MTRTIRARMIGLGATADHPRRPGRPARPAPGHRGQPDPRPRSRPAAGLDSPDLARRRHADPAPPGRARLAGLGVPDRDHHPRGALPPAPDADPSPAGPGAAPVRRPGTGRRRRPALRRRPCPAHPVRGCDRAGCGHGARQAHTRRPRVGAAGRQPSRRDGHPEHNDGPEPRRDPDPHRHLGRVPVVDRAHRARRRSPLARDRRPQPRHPRPAMADIRRDHPDPSHRAQRPGRVPARRRHLHWSAPATPSARSPQDQPRRRRPLPPDLPGLPPHPPGRRAAPGRPRPDPSRVAADHPRHRRQGRCRANSGGSAAARGPRQPGNRPRSHRNQARRRRSSDHPTDDEHPRDDHAAARSEHPRHGPAERRSGQRPRRLPPRRTVQTRRRGC